MNKIIKKLKFTNKEINIVVNLVNNYYDVGFYTNSGEVNNEVIDNTVTEITVTGVTASRLNELKTYTDDINKRYKKSVNGSNGILVSETDNNIIVYIIDNIKYFDDNDTTTFQFQALSKYDDIENNFMFKEDKFLNYSDYNKKSNLDIVRQSLNIFESHMRLSDIRNVEELTLYGGSYYNIFKNS